MLKVSRRELDKIIESLNLYPSTKRICLEYKNAAHTLDLKEAKLKDMLYDLKKEHADVLSSSLQATDVSEIIYLQKQARELVNESNTIEVLLEEMESERMNLKLAFIPKFEQSLESDRQNRPEYSVIETVQSVRWELIKAIVDLAQAMQSQQTEISEVFEVLYDPTVREVYPRADYLINQAKVKPLYEERLDTVISRYQLFSAVDGNIPPEIKPNTKGGK